MYLLMQSHARKKYPKHYSRLAFQKFSKFILLHVRNPSADATRYKKANWSACYAGPVNFLMASLVVPLRKVLNANTLKPLLKAVSFQYSFLLIVCLAVDLLRMLL